MLFPAQITSQTRHLNVYVAKQIHISMSTMPDKHRIF